MPTRSVFQIFSYGAESSLVERLIVDPAILARHGRHEVQITGTSRPRRVDKRRRR